MLGGDWTDGTMTDFKWRHFQGDVILWAVRWYCRYPISYRDLEEMLAERGISVDHTTIYRWVQCYAPDRKSTRLNPVTNAHLVCRLLLENKKNTKATHQKT